MYLLTKEFGNPNVEIGFYTGDQMKEIRRWNDIKYGSSTLCPECFDYTMKHLDE